MLAWPPTSPLALNILFSSFSVGFPELKVEGFDRENLFGVFEQGLDNRWAQWGTELDGHNIETN